MSAICPICSRVRPSDLFVCRECVGTAQKHLASIADFASWCDEKRARMGSTWSVGGGSRACETPVPFDPRVSKVLGPIHNDLTTLARIVWEEAPGLSEPRGTDTASVADWLLGHVPWIATTEHAEVAFPTWERANGNLERLFDRPPEKVYLGRCNASTDFGPCIESLYVEAGDMPAQVTCPRCTRDVVVSDRRDELAVGVENYLGTARELSRLLRLVLGEDASPRMMWAYAKHGLIQSRGSRVEFDTMGRQREVPTYRIGEVREAARIIALDEQERKRIRKTMRGEVVA